MRFLGGFFGIITRDGKDDVGVVLIGWERGKGREAGGVMVLAVYPLAIFKQPLLRHFNSFTLRILKRLTTFFSYQ